MAKWTKSDIKKIAAQMTSFHLMHRMYAPAEAIRAKVEAETAAVVISGLESWVVYESGRAKENKDAAAHFETHPSIYKSSTPEMVERFRNLAQENIRAAERSRKLAERIKTDGVPSEALDMYRATRL
jgi:hypothetical protein